MALKSRARSTRLLVAALVAASLLTITVDYRQGTTGPLAGLGRAALAIVSPMQEAVTKVIRPVGNFLSTLVHLPEIRAENERLKTENASLLEKLAVEGSDAKRLSEVEDLLNLESTLDIPTVAAQVIAGPLSNFEWTITIDRGTGDGVHEGMPIVTGGPPGQLVGHVVQAGPTSSVVRLIIDPDSAITGRLSSSLDTGSLQGRGEADLQMSFVDPATIVTPDELVVTAGYRLPGDLRGLDPPGIVIGTVSRVLEDPAALEKFVLVRPAVDFSSLEFVLVVLTDVSG